MSQSPSRSISIERGGSASTRETRVPGCAARRAARAVGTRVELPLGKETRRTRPARSPAMAATSSSAAVSPARMPEAWRTKTSPAWVRRISRPVRIRSGVPAEASSAFICWLTAGWVQPSSRAAAEKEPVAATARRTRRWRASIMRSSISEAWGRERMLPMGFEMGARKVPA